MRGKRWTEGRTVAGREEGLSSNEGSSTVRRRDRFEGGTRREENEEVETERTKDQGHAPLFPATSDTFARYHKSKHKQRQRRRIPPSGSLSPTNSPLNSLGVFFFFFL